MAAFGSAIMNYEKLQKQILETIEGGKCDTSKWYVSKTRRVRIVLQLQKTQPHNLYFTLYRENWSTQR